MTRQGSRRANSVRLAGTGPVPPRPLFVDHELKADEGRIGPHDHLTRAEVLALLPTSPFWPSHDSKADRDRGHMRLLNAAKILDWLADHPGDGWQERWRAADADSGKEFVLAAPRPHRCPHPRTQDADHHSGIPCCLPGRPRADLPRLPRPAPSRSTAGRIPRAHGAGVARLPAALRAPQGVTGHLRRPYGTPCKHEHACIRCPVLQMDPRQRPRLLEIIRNLRERITEARANGWLGEVEGLQVSFDAAMAKLNSLKRTSTDGRPQLVDLGMPLFTDTSQPKSSTSASQG